MTELNGSVAPLSPFDLVIATGLVVAAGLVSLGLRLGLEKRLAVAAVRTVVQLLLVGYILRFVFDLNHPAPVIAIMLVMTFIAGHAAVQRVTRRFPGMLVYAFITLVLSGLTTTFVVTGLIIHVTPWRPQYAIPLLGMILGNGLTGISISLDLALESFAERRNEIEMELALGATRWEAAQRPLRESVRRGMIPIINSMTVVGIVSLPGMMTGQILSNTDPLTAVKYQIVVMFMIAAATSLGCMLSTMIVFFRCFNARHQLRQGFITRKG